MSNHTAAAPQWMTKPYFQQVLQASFKDQAITVNTFEVSPGSAIGDNYLCQVFRIKLDIVRNGQDESLSIIGKLLPKTDTTKTLIEDFNFHTTETNVFSKTLPELYRKFPQAPLMAPQTYHVDKESDIIYMEDLKSSGFYLIDRNNKSLSLQPSLLVIEALAQYHAYCYLLIKEDPTLKKLYDGYFWKHKEGFVIEKICINGLEEILKNLPNWPVPEDLKRKLQNVGPKIFENGVGAYGRKNTAFNTLLHGDCWSNNMMFRNDEQGVAEVKLLDFQLVNYNSIGLDLNYFIYTSTDIEVKTEYLEKLFQVYYDTFVGITGAVEGFSVQRVQQEFEERLPFGFLCALFLRPGVLSTTETDLDAAINDEKSDKNLAIYHNESYIKEMVILLPFFEKHDLLDEP